VLGKSDLFTEKMPVNITYMGTKKGLAPLVAEVIRQCQQGVLLDAFAGMCSVAEQVAVTRQIWTNDVQVFAAEVGTALFASRDEPLGALITADMHFAAFERHRSRLAKRHVALVDAEDALLECDCFSAFTRCRVRLSRFVTAQQQVGRRRNRELFTTIYPDTYFGVHQAIEADSIITAIASNHRLGRTTDDHKRWLTIALGRALLKIANSTGHFAQFLSPKPSSYERFLRQRRRSLWAEWLFSIGELHPVGTADWRQRNRSFNEDSLALLPKLATAKHRPAVIYADPPYTDDQYSRFYHIFETLVLYDYPAVSGAGRYRSHRHQTSFSQKAQAVRAFEGLAQSAANTGADLVLSYPSNGLIHQVGGDPKDILREYFRTVECCHSIQCSHSTFGASKGPAQSNVTELIYLAKTS
jgi:adenine-specific DNA-methyltransferase